VTIPSLAFYAGSGLTVLDVDPRAFVVAAVEEEELGVSQLVSKQEKDAFYRSVVKCYEPFLNSSTD